MNLIANYLLVILGLMLNFTVSAIETSTPLFKDPELKTFGDEVEAANIENLFQGTGPFTAFVPSNEAFDKYGKEKLQELNKPENNEKLTNLLLYHIVSGKYMAKSLKPMSLKTINGKPVEIKGDQGKFTVNHAKIIKTDLVGPNGVIHVIDEVLTP